MYKLCFYIPDSHLNKVKESLFKIGAGKIGKYDHCSWQILGQGQFRPLLGSNPSVGRLNNIEYLAEWKVEMIIDYHLITPCIKVLKSEHPYEAPAYEIIHLFVDPTKNK